MEHCCQLCKGRVLVLGKNAVLAFAGDPSGPCIDSGIRAIAMYASSPPPAVKHQSQNPCCLQVSLSHVVMPMVKMVPRGFTAAADAYLTPHILRWG